MTKKCIRCGREFEATNGNCKRCAECKTEHRKEYFHRYRAEHREEINANNRFYMRKVRKYGKTEETACATG